MSQLFHDTDHIFDWRSTVVILIEYLHVFLVGVRPLLKSRFSVYKLLKALEGGTAAVEVTSEDGVLEVVFVLLDQELKTNRIAELLELRPS